MLAPDLGDGELVNKIAEARFPLPTMIVWLDELQRFLPGPYLATGHTPISAAAVRRLLEAPTPVVLLGTLWPEYARQLRTTELDPATGVHRPSYPAALDVLDDWRLQELPLLSFSDSERKAAARLAAQDPRLVEAIANHDYNVTEVLAGAREIIRRYERATKRQQAVLHVAVDARRLGIQAPLTESLLRDAALAHLTSHHPDDTWFKQALDELTATNRPQDRATAPLIPITTIDRRSVLGYTVADYLLQRLTRQRCDQRLPAVAWQAFVIHTPNRDDRLRLADSAVDQRMYDHAEALYQYLVNTGDGDWQAAYKLVGLLAMQGRIDGLRALANTGQWYAADRLAYLLIDQGRVEEAIEILRTHADAGNMPAAYKLVHILVEQGHGDEAILVLRARASTGDQYARRRLPEVLAQLGRADEAMEILRARADAGEWFATYQLRYLSTNQTHSG